MTARYRGSVGCTGCNVGGWTDFFKQGFLELVGLDDEAAQLAKIIDKALPNELEAIADFAAPYAAKLLPPPYGTAAQAYMMFRNAAQSGDYDLAAQIRRALKDAGVPDPIDLLERAKQTGANVETTAQLGSDLVHAAQSLGLAAAAVAGGAFVLSQLPRATRFHGRFGRRRR